MVASVLTAAVLRVAPPAVAQESASCPPVAGEPYLLCQVEQPPRPNPRNIPPRYADMLLQAGVSGTVRVRFVVDTTGHVRSDPRMEVLAATHDMFAFAVQEAVQMHGGIGMTDEFDVGLFMKRVRVGQELFGDSNFHAR